MMQYKQFKRIEHYELEKIQGGDWLKNVGDYLNGLVSGFKSVLGSPKK